MDSFAEALSALGALLFFVVFIWGNVEGAIEYFIKPILDWGVSEEEDRRGFTLRWISFFIGVVVAVLLGLDLVSLLATAVGANPISPLVGVVMTGIFMARGANWLHDRFTNPLGPVISNVFSSPGEYLQTPKVSPPEWEYPPDAQTPRK